MHLVIYYLENRVKQSKYKADIQKNIEYIYWNNYLLTKSIEVLLSWAYIWKIF